jgi:hypothetical protein
VAGLVQKQVTYKKACAEISEDIALIAPAYEPVPYFLALLSTTNLACNLVEAAFSVGSCFYQHT